MMASPIASSRYFPGTPRCSSSPIAWRNWASPTASLPRTRLSAASAPTAPACQVGSCALCARPWVSTSALSYSRRANIMKARTKRFIGFPGARRPSSAAVRAASSRSEEHTSELQSRLHLVCRLLLEKKKKQHRHVRRDDYHKDG